MKMNIACATDNNFVPYCGIMLTSLFENNKEHSFSVYILTKGISEENVTKFNSLASKYHSCITMIELDNETFKSCPIREKDPVSIVAYYRLALPYVLPNDIQKVLYLDVDIIINKQIDTLYNTDINNVALSACADLTIDEAITAKLGVDKDCYFNTGVLLINLGYWRAHQIAEQCFDFIERNPDKITFWDQDALNVILHGAIPFMDISYNFQARYLNTLSFATFSKEKKQYILESAHNPAIIHFTTTDKPWNRICASPYKPLFLHYKKKSLWKDHPLQRNYKTIRQLIGWERRMLEIRLGLRKPWFVVKDVKYQK